MIRPPPPRGRRQVPEVGPRTPARDETDSGGPGTGHEEGGTTTQRGDDTPAPEWDTPGLDSTAVGLRSPSPSTTWNGGWAGSS
jgi:hypothetical protein